MSAFEFAPPQFTEKDVTEMLKAKYGINGTLRALESERDQNFAVNTDQGRFGLLGPTKRQLDLLERCRISGLS